MHPRYEPIADNLVDHDLLLYPQHTVYTHLGCAMLRTAMGITLMNPSLSNHTRTSIIIIMIVALVLFGSKYIKKVMIDGEVLWKSYPRMLLAYSAALCLTVRKQNELAGALIVADALMGVQSRHMASVLSTTRK